MKYAHIDNNGKLLGWYDRSIHADIPKPNIEVTEAQWQNALDLGANAYEKGSFIVKDFRTAEEIAEELKQKQLTEAKEYLDNTDWIIVKINEAQLLGQDIQPLLTKYELELLERENKRLTINQLEG